MTRKKILNSAYTKYLFGPWIFICTSGSLLLLAMYYIYSLSPLYTVSIYLPLKQQNSVSPREKTNKTAVNFQKQQLNYVLSPNVLAEAAVKSGFQINYYEDNLIEDTRLENNSSPIKIVTTANDWLLKKSFQVELYGDNHFKTDYDGDNRIYEYNKAINENGTIFKIIKTNSGYVSGKKIRVEVASRSKVLKQLNSLIISCCPNPDSNKVLLSTTTSDINKSVDLLTGIKTTYLDSALTSTSSRSARHIDKKIDSLGEEIKKYPAIIGSLQIGKRNQPARRAKYNRVESSGLKKQNDILKIISTYLKIPDNQFAFVPNTFGLQDNKLKTLINELNDKEIERQKLLRNAKPGSVSILNNNQQIAALKTTVHKLTDSLSTNIQIALHGPMKLHSSPGNLPDQTNYSVFSTLKKEQQARIALYISLTKKRDSINASHTHADALNNYQNHIRIVRGNKPVTNILIAALVIGLVIPLPFRLLKLANGSGLAIDEIVNEIKIPILGSLDFDNKESAIIDPVSYNSLVGRQLIKIKNSIENCRNNKTILFTSVNPGDGKSFLAKNIAIALGAQGKPVLLIQAGFVKVPNDLLDSDISKGLYSFFENDEVSLDNISYQTKFNNLSIIESGRLDPAKLLDYIRMQNLIKKARSKYEFIILDSCATGINELDNLMRKQTDMIVTVLNTSSSSYSNLDSLNQLYKKLKERNLYMIINNNLLYS